MRIDKKILIKNPNKSLSTVHLFYILDSSGSMNNKSWGSKSLEPTKYESAVKGMKLEFEELSNSIDVNYTYSFIEFSNYGQIVTHFYKTSDKNLVQGTFEKLKCFNHSTALHETVYTTLNKISQEITKGEKHLVSVMTDGQNTDYIRYRAEDVKRIIGELEPKGVTVNFIGLEQDVQVVTKEYGLHFSNTMSYNNTGVGLEAAILKRSAATRGFSKKVAAGDSVSQDFFTEEQK